MYVCMYVCMYMYAHVCTCMRMSVCMYVCMYAQYSAMVRAQRVRAAQPVVWDHWETVLLGQILAGCLLEGNFDNLKALGPAIKIPFWDPWETVRLTQILAGSLLI